jgi:conjugal transfer pilus assembly protein TraE
MIIRDYLASIDLNRRLGHWQHQAIIALGVTNCLTALALTLQHTKVILVPPTLPGEVEIARNQGSGTLKETWALYVAELIGNVTPGNAAFIERSLGPLLDAGIYRDVMALLGSQVTALRADRVSVRFRTREVLYEAKTDRVYVSGEQTSQGPGGNPETHPRTYEFRIAFRHYRPVVEHIDVYAGEPHLEGTLPNGRPEALADSKDPS